MGAPEMIHLEDEEATLELGRALGRQLAEGSVVLLIGELGAGKTTLVRGVAEGLEIPPEVRVKSPSYQRLNRYLGGRLVLNHVDAYFLERFEDLEESGLSEWVDGGEIVIIEWGDRIGEKFERRLEIHLEHVVDGGRSIDFRAIGADLAAFGVRFGT